ncbi:MAG: VOC family protein [Deltaproteobacteria bacterium]|nr:VOC family protein [Deltaproteobacteria bacterium]
MMMGEKSLFSKLAHIAVVVKDIERAVEFYSSLGIGPFITPAKVLHDNSGYVKRTYRGSPAGYIGLIVREAQIGPVILQLVQHIEGDCVEKDFLDRKGEGVFHLGFVVDDIDKEEAKAVKLGLNVIQSGRRADGSGNAFFDTESLGGVMLEIKQVPSEGDKMSEEMRVGEKSPFSELQHITVVVEDMERAVKFYSSVGIEPFVPPDKHVFPKKTLWGKPINFKLLIRETQIGSVVLQLVEHIEGEDVYKEFVDQRGEGVQHLGFKVDDIDKEEDKAVKMGLQVTQRGRREDGTGYTYFDTESLGGVVFEIRQNPSD